MATIPVNLPQALHEFVEAKVKEGRFTGANEYIVALVESAREARSAIEAALIEGIESGPATEWTENEWAELKQRVSLRCEAREGDAELHRG